MSKQGELLVQCNRWFGKTDWARNKSIGMVIGYDQILIIKEGHNSPDYDSYINSKHIFQRVDQCKKCKWGLKLVLGFCKKEYKFEGDY